MWYISIPCENIIFNLTLTLRRISNLLWRISQTQKFKNSFNTKYFTFTKIISYAQISQTASKKCMFSNTLVPRSTEKYLLAQLLQRL